MNDLSLAGSNPRRPRPRCGFTLIELLTVVAIMALLIGILVPSLNRARITAKSTASQARLHAISVGIELFRNATDEYPDSENGYYYRNPQDPWLNRMNGATKITRALLGPEATAGAALGCVPPKRFRQSTDPKTDFYTTVNPQQRLGSFMDSAKLNENYFALDDLELPYTGRIPDELEDSVSSLGELPKPAIFVDSFEFPVLYYKADPMGGPPMAAPKGGDPASTGYYYHQDNIYFTGASSADVDGWELELDDHESDALGVVRHPIRHFGDAVNPDALESGQSINTFCKAIHLHSEEAERATEDLKRLRKPHNHDTFLLWTPGHDGLYGTSDDVKNFGE